MSEPAGSAAPRGASLRVKLLALAALGLLLLLLHQGVNYRRVLAGDPYAAGELLLGRAVCRRVALEAESALARAVAAENLSGLDPEAMLGPEDVRVLQRAAGDPAPLVRAVALHELVTARSRLPLADAVELLAMALDDQTPLAREELAAARAGWCLAVASRHAEEQPGASFSPALLAAALVHEVDDPPETASVPAPPGAASPAAGASPVPFLRRQGAWPTAVADARALLAAWRAWLLEHPEAADAPPGAALERLRAALAGHPTHDPARHGAASGAR